MDMETVDQKSIDLCTRYLKVSRASSTRCTASWNEKLKTKRWIIVASKHVSHSMIFVAGNNIHLHNAVLSVSYISNNKVAEHIGSLVVMGTFNIEILSLYQYID